MGVLASSLQPCGESMNRSSEIAQMRVIFVGQNIRGFVVEHLPTNEATLPTFACNTSSNHEYINHELAKYAEPRIF